MRNKFRIVRDKNRNQPSTNQPQYSVRRDVHYIDTCTYMQCICMFSQNIYRNGAPRTINWIAAIFAHMQYEWIRGDSCRFSVVIVVVVRFSRFPCSTLCTFDTFHIDDNMQLIEKSTWEHVKSPFLFSIYKYKFLFIHINCSRRRFPISHNTHSECELRSSSFEWLK